MKTNSVNLLYCPNCKVACSPTERPRAFECPRCHEIWHRKPTRRECEILAKIVMGKNFKRGDMVALKRNGWVGVIVGAGPGRDIGRWENAQWYYVDWKHRQPAGVKHYPEELRAYTQEI